MKVKVSTVVSVIGCVGALLGIGAYLFNFGDRLGRMEQSIERLEVNQTKLMSRVGMDKDDMLSRFTDTDKVFNDRLREHEGIMQKMSESIIALTTEVRIRNRDRAFFQPGLSMKTQAVSAAKKVDTKLNQMKAAL